MTASGRPVIVAIDGPSGVGKTTTSKLVARELALPHIDTGAMYRAVGLKALRQGVDPSDSERAAELARSTSVEFGWAKDAVRVFSDGEDVTEAIRTPHVSMAASTISSVPGVRRVLVQLQQELGRQQGGVLEGRDIGTKVFPETPHKFFLTARPEVRVQRRYDELQEKGEPNLSMSEVAKDLERRDHQDSTREDSPLTYDETYRVIDTSDMSIEEVVAEIVESVRSAS